MFIKSLVSSGEFANPVMGISKPLFNINCKEYNLSREWEMADEEFNAKTPMDSN